MSCFAGDAADLRVIMTSEQHCADFEKLADVIKVHICTPEMTKHDKLLQASLMWELRFRQLLQLACTVISTPTTTVCMSPGGESCA